MARKKNPLADIDKRLDAIADLGEKDRVQALRALLDVRSTGADYAGPPAPNDTTSMLKALIDIMKSAGKPLVTAAMVSAFPEAPLETQTPMDGPPPSGDSLD